MKYYQRKCEKDIVDALKAVPVIFITGPRQAGKSTLAQKIANKHFKPIANKPTYYTFDDIFTLSHVVKSPEDFIFNLDHPVILDEIQFAKDIYRPIKVKVDQLRYAHLTNKKNPNPNGLFILTGSAALMVLPELADALVGRMFIFKLLPLSGAEIYATKTNFIDNVFSDTFILPKKLNPIDIPSIIKSATYPELANVSEQERDNWLRSYANTIIQRDLKEFIEVDKVTQISDLLRLLAAHAGGLLNEASLARDLKYNQSTLRRHRNILTQVYFINPIDPWYRNLGKRLVKAPKNYFTDTGMLCHLLGIDPNDFDHLEGQTKGRIFENLVASELTKLITDDMLTRLNHFRSHNGDEVDFIIEQGRKLVAIEVKAKKQLHKDDFKGIEIFQTLVNKDFHIGIVLYLGDKVVKWGDNIIALPVSALWS